MLKPLSRFILSILGWTTSHAAPVMDKCVLIGAPHTSNWDFPLTLLGLSSMGVRFNWVAKHTLFFWPMGTLLRRIGGVPVDRSQGSSFLKKAIELYGSREKLVLAIAPEGTRSKAPYWKIGFYLIAHQAKVPIALGYIDYATKMIGLDEVIIPTGNFEEDFAKIKSYYQGKTGKYPENQGEIRVKERKKRKEGKDLG